MTEIVINDGRQVAVIVLAIALTCLIWYRIGASQQPDDRDALLREAHSLLNDKQVEWKFYASPWRDRRDAWIEKVKGGQ